MSKNVTKNITIYKSISLSLSLCLTLLTQEAEGVHVEKFDKVQIAEKQKFDKVQKLTQHPSLFQFFRRGGVTLDETCTFIHRNLHNNQIVDKYHSYNYDKSLLAKYYIFHFQVRLFSYLYVLNFGTKLKTPSLPLKKMTKEWQKRAKSAFSNALLGEYFSENCA